jgi:S-adenosyl methyltransferase
LTLVKHIEMAPKQRKKKLAPISGDGPKAPNAPPEPPDRDGWRAAIPSSARIYDYFPGGKDNYPAGRDAGDPVIAHLPNIREATQINRAFVRRAVRYLADRPQAVTARITTVRSVVAVVLSRPDMVGRKSIKWVHAL